MDNFEYLVNELRKLGINKKEATLYMALLELGPTTVQQLARKVNLSRPTVYRLLENLQKKDLVSKESKKGEKSRSFFVAGSPDHFLRILRIQQRKAEEQEREFLRIISILQTKYYLLSDKNEIKVCPKKIAFEDFLNSNSENIFILFGTNAVITKKELGRIYAKIRSRMGKKLLIREIHQKNAGPNSLEYVQQTFVNSIPKKFNSKLLIISDKVFLFDNQSASCIERADIKELLILMFEEIWKSNQ